MSQWARENPEAMEEIAALPPSRQVEAMRGAMPDPAEAADRAREERKYADLEEDELDREDLDYLRAQASVEWEERHGGGL